MPNPGVVGFIFLSFNEDRKTHYLITPFIAIDQPDFSWLILGSSNSLVLAVIQSRPRNASRILSPVITGPKISSASEKERKFKDCVNLNTLIPNILKNSLQSSRIFQFDMYSFYSKYTQEKSVFIFSCLWRAI